jgi:GATA-binding protein
MFDAVNHAENGNGFPHSPSFPTVHLNQPSPGSTTTLNGDHHHDLPPTIESLIAENNKLKTRVNELEVINDLFKGRVAQLEQSEAGARRAETVSRETEDRLRAALDDSQRREVQLKRKVEDFERDCGDQRDGRAAKKMRVSDIVDDNRLSPALSASS